MNGTVIWEFLAFLNLQKILGNNQLLRKYILQKTVVWCP